MNELLSPKVKKVEIGTGSFAVVYREYYLDKTLILKEARNPKYNDMLEREHRILKNLAGTPHIIPVIGEVYSQRGLTSFRMEDWGNGKTLFDLDEKWRKIHPVDKAYVFLALIKAWEEAWKKGIVHNDIQLRNMMIFPEIIQGETRPALTDWGNAFSLAERAQQEKVSEQIMINSCWHNEIQKWKTILESFFGDPELIPTGITDFFQNLSPYSLIYDGLKLAVFAMDKELNRQKHLSEINRHICYIIEEFGEITTLETLFPLSTSNGL